jgi:integrase
MIPNEYTPVFSSCLADRLQAFLINKRAAGNKYVSEARILSRLDKYLLGLKDDTAYKEFLLSWGLKRGSESAKTHHIRVSLLRQLCLFLNRHGEQILLPERPKKHFKSFVPYIFTHEQMNTICFNADAKTGNISDSHFRLNMPVLLRLFYGSGMRVSEALSLRIRHVNLEKGIITVWCSKNVISRFVPIKPSLQKLIVEHIDRIYAVTKDDDFLFPTARFQRYSAKTIYNEFREILWKSDISHGGRGKGPRLHDIRHTFAVHSLQKLINERYDTYLLLLILSTYLGHTNVHATEKYLRLTAEMYPDILEKVKQTCGRMTPEVDYEEN